MRLFHDPIQALHQTRGELKDGVFRPAFESPARLDAVVAAVEGSGLRIDRPQAIDPLPTIRKVHAPDYLAFLERVHARWRMHGRDGDVLPLSWPGPLFRQDMSYEHLGLDGQIGLAAFDGGTPIMEHTWQVTLAASRAALSAVAALDRDRVAVSLMRPPGHHAMPGQYGGYCYVNFAAVAAQALLDKGARKIAILDVDYHHGNGSQAIFYDRNDVLVVNLHSDPRDEYPYFLGHADETGAGKGEGANLNIPLPKGSDWSAYAPALDHALQRVAASGADALVVSFGADTYEGDPLGRFAIKREDFTRMGSKISALDLPTAIILEGGYAIEDLGTNVLQFLSGFDD